MIKGQISGKLVSSGISHIALALVYSEKTSLKKLMIMISIGNYMLLSVIWILFHEEMVG